MIKKRRWLWVILFTLVALLLGGLATGWNVVLVRDYQHLVALAKKLPFPPELDIPSPQASLVVRMILGTLGFVAALAITVLLFIKLLNEMRLNQLQSEFLATVTHELKTPIAAIELCTSLIRAGGISETEKQRLWESHESELKRLKDEVGALLEAAHWQSKPQIHIKNSVLLEYWIQQSMNHWRNILGPHATLKREGDPLQCYVLLDLKTFNLILDNLFSNAKKFARKDPHVTIRTFRIPKTHTFSKARWCIQIEDQGWGFDPADKKKIFNRFFRSRNIAPYAIPGTGLGLYLANSASRAIGLTLSADSAGLGKGALFSLEGPEQKL